MNTVVSFKTPNGEDMIVLSKSDYEALLEKAELLEDVAAVDAYHRKLAAGEEEAIPEEFANRLIDGDSPIRVYRELRGLSARNWPRRPVSARPFFPKSRPERRTAAFRH
jgi:hypothetical protein